MERLGKIMNKAKRKTVVKGNSGGITPEFEISVKEFMDEHADVLKELAKR